MNTILETSIIAHRGESHIAPENTLAAVNLAWDNGIKAVEIDVQLTADKEIVVIHDANTKRVGNANYVIGKSRLASLKTIDVGLYKNLRWKGEQIPTLTEVMQTIPADGKLVIEIKSGHEIIDPLCELLQAFNLPESQIEIICFNRKLLEEVKRILPQYKMLWLLDLDYYLPAWLLPNNTARTIRKVLNGNLDGVNVWAGKKISKRYVTELKNQGLLVYTWTVNDVSVAKKMLEYNVDAITTDRPAWLKEQLANASVR